MPSFRKRWLLWLLLLGFVGMTAYYTWQDWSREELPDAFASSNGRLESVEIDVASERAGRLLYVISTTSLGLLLSSFMKSQVAAIFSTAILTMIPATQYSGLITPVESLEGFGRWIGMLYPTTYFLQISRGAFAKGLGFVELSGFFWPLILIGPGLILVTASLLSKQEG